MCWLLPYDRRMVVAAGRLVPLFAEGRHRDHPLTARDRQFRHPLRIRGIERLPAGAYEVITDEETIEGLTVAANRRIATMMMVPAEGVRDSMEMLSIGSAGLANAQAAVASAAHD